VGPTVEVAHLLEGVGRLDPLGLRELEPPELHEDDDDRVRQSHASLSIARPITEEGKSEVETHLEDEQAVGLAERVALLLFFAERLDDDVDGRVWVAAVACELGAVENPQSAVREARRDAAERARQGGEVGRLGRLPARHCEREGAESAYEAKVTRRENITH